MRICYLADASSVHTRKWASYFVERQHEVHVISFEHAKIEGATVHVLKLPVLIPNATFALKVASIYRIRVLINKLKPDVLHAHYVTNYGFFGALCNFNPYVITAWGSDILPVPEARLISMIKRYIAIYALKKGDVITCDAEHIKRTMRGLGVPEEKLRLIFFGIDTRKFSPRQKSEKLKAKLGIYDSPAVISLRNLKPVYDVKSLVRSVPLVQKEIPESKFIIAGRGPEERNLRELAKTLGVSDSVRFVGFVPNDELPDYLNSMDVYVSTSLSDAGIATSTAEAMSCGLPVIVTDAADNREWVKDGINGFVIPIRDPQSLAEKIIYLLRNENVGKQFGKIGRKIIEERNNYYKEMEKMEEIYRELLRRHKK